MLHSGGLFASPCDPMDIECDIPTINLSVVDELANTLPLAGRRKLCLFLPGGTPFVSCEWVGSSVQDKDGLPQAEALASWAGGLPPSCRRACSAASPRSEAPVEWIEMRFLQLTSETAGFVEPI